MPPLPPLPPLPRWRWWLLRLKALLRYHVFGVHTPGFVCCWCMSKNNP